MDSSLFQFVNGLIGRSVWLDRFMYLSADGLPFVCALVLVGLWLTWQHRQQLGAFLAVVSAFSALGVAQIIIRLFPRPRPFNVLPAHLLVNASQDPSFPSDHATFAFAIAALVWRFNRKVATWLFALALVTGHCQGLCGGPLSYRYSRRRGAGNHHGRYRLVCQQARLLRKVTKKPVRSFGTMACGGENRGCCLKPRFITAR